jgi:hypothetical protein
MRVLGKRQRKKQLRIGLEMPLVEEVSRAPARTWRGLLLWVRRQRRRRERAFVFVDGGEGDVLKHGALKH